LERRGGGTSLIRINPACAERGYALLQQAAMPGHDGFFYGRPG
jgi:hypothetical protein